MNCTLEQMAGFIESCGACVVAMEAASVNWIPVYGVLERAGLEVRLVNAHDEAGERAQERQARRSWTRSGPKADRLRGHKRNPDWVQGA